MEFSINSVEAAQRRIAGRVHLTPVITSSSIDARTSAQLHFKCENLQRAGSFKARGAFNALLALGSSGRTDGVVCVSSGNHGQAVALAARELECTATVVMPADSNFAKIAATRAYGANVITDGVTEANREEIFLDVARRLGARLVHPFNDHNVIAGQGTIALEMVTQIREPDAVVVPVGGGGLIAGIATVVADRWPNTRIIGVEPEAAADAKASLEKDEIVALGAPPHTVVDGVKAMSVGEKPFDIIRETVDDIVVVSDGQVMAALELLWSRTKMVTEPAAALGLAAVLYGKVEGKLIATVLSGGNPDLEVVSRYFFSRSVQT